MGSIMEEKCVINQIEREKYVTNQVVSVIYCLYISKPRKLISLPLEFGKNISYFSLL